MTGRFIAILLLALGARAAFAHTEAPDSSGAARASTRRVIENTVVDTLPVVDVTDTFDRLVRRYQSSSQGSVTAAQLRARPVYRSGELLETVPGLVISQHSGEGKANQYYLRGFNLDHGTDFATFVGGIPVNMPTHGHGQGYSDLSFVIPELITGVEYRKGTGFAEEGDFATAGAAHLAYANWLEAPILEATVGRDGYARALFAGSHAVAGGELITALEVFHNDGPWVNPDDYRKVNGVLRWGRTGQYGGFRLTGMGYDGRWNSTDQVAQRAVDEGRIDRFGSLDDSDGGNSRRYSLSADWQRFSPSSFSQATAYVMDYRMDLFSNFTYFLDDTTNGDQFEQVDRRVVSGLRADQTWRGRWGGRGVEGKLGLQARRDDIGDVALHHTVRRTRLSTTREDRVEQTSVSPWTQLAVAWAPTFRSTLGLRGDAYWFDVRSDDPRNSGSAHAAILSPKLDLAFGPWAKTAWFLGAGTGFHSNDARGSTITVDPVTGDPASRVDPLVRTVGAEGGLRTEAIPGLQLALTAWWLDVDSELLFIGDAGSTEASRPSRRFGLELHGHHRVGLALLDGNVAVSRARFRDDDPAGDLVPGSVATTIAGGVSIPDWNQWSAGLRVRYLGPRPLVEDGSVRSDPSTMLNALVGWRWQRHLGLELEVFNLLDSRISDIDYWYASRLPGEAPGGVDDLHFHPQPPRTLRLKLTGTL